MALRAGGLMEEAIASFDRALAIEPRFVGALIERGNALLDLGRPQDAAETFRRALILEPNNALALNGCGNACLDQGNASSALECFERALAANPASAWLHSNRGTALANLGRHVEALAACDTALKLEPTDAAAHHTRADVLHDLGKHQEAVDCYDRALATDPGRVRAWSNRGHALFQLRRFDAAISSYDHALSGSAGARASRRFIANAYVNRGAALHEVGRFDAALDSSERAISADAGLSAAHVNRGTALYSLGLTEAAVQSYDRAIAIEPGDAAAHEGRANALLRLGRFAEGWTEYEWRWKNSKSVLYHDRRHVTTPLWLGHEAIRGKSILLHAEQGYGDTLQFCRYAQLVAAAGATVTLEVHGPLVRLMKTVDGVAQVIARGEPAPAVDYQCPLMSVPLALGTTLASIPAAIPYLRGEPELIEEWKVRLGPKRRPRVGLVWSGGLRPNQPESWSVNARRNIALEKLAILKHADVEFYSLQKGQPAESELAELLRRQWDGPGLIDHTAQLTDFADTAAFIENLDLLISVDTATAHLAAALGRPVWVMSRFDSCWRWLLDRDDSPWYPTLRLYRQNTPGVWEDVVQRVRSDLGTLVARGPAGH
jgi:tetratricopeptide (TPR) repeat protein